jgi:hypothetical protein
VNREDGDWLSVFLERHGLPTLLLLLGGWYVSSAVLEPMTSTAKQFITDIREANVIIQDELMQIDRENLSRWDKAFDLQQRNSDLAETISERMGDLEIKVERILSEFEKMRMLFTQPAIDDKGLRDGKDNYDTATDDAEED